MFRRLRQAACCGVILVSFPSVASAQTFEAVGTRAAGMAGAFVAVADDSSAVYWNPGGLAAGAYFSLLLDVSGDRALPDGDPHAGSCSSTLLALGMPALGLSYYRLRATTLGPADGSQFASLQNLVTHHGGVTVVQSLTDNIAVGTTLKLVRGIAAAGVAPLDDREDLLDIADDLSGASSTRFDADLGVMATFGAFKAGLAVRNVTEPGFDLPGDSDELTLKRQTRAGVSYAGVQGLLVALDVDVERARGSLGEVRNLAAGGEFGLSRRVVVRSGVRFNTLGDQPGGHAPVVGVGGSYAVRASVLIDGQATLGSDAGDRGWGIGARFTF
jgi:F plasmid transfer operon, TraF, protein